MGRRLRRFIMESLGTATTLLNHTLRSQQPYSWLFVVEDDCDPNRSDANEPANSTLPGLTMEMEATTAFIVYVDFEE